jgi:hypothetical protein
MKPNDYYYYLNLPFEFNKEVPDFGDKGHILFSKQDVPKFEAWLNTLGLTIRHADVFRKKPGWPDTRFYKERATIHIDGHKFDNHAKINFVYNSGTSKIVWYKLKEGRESFPDQSGAYTPSRSAWLEDCVVAESAFTNRPMLVNVGQLHDIQDVDQTRYCFSFQLAPLNNPTDKIYWSDVTIYFKDYIEYQT